MNIYQAFSFSLALFLMADALFRRLVAAQQYPRDYIRAIGITNALRYISFGVVNATGAVVLARILGRIS